MLADGVVDLRTASWLASANYLGYLAGALLCTFEPWIGARVKRLPPIGFPKHPPPKLTSGSSVCATCPRACLIAPRAPDHVRTRVRQCVLRASSVE